MPSFNPICRCLVLYTPMSLFNVLLHLRPQFLNNSCIHPECGYSNPLLFVSFYLWYSLTAESRDPGSYPELSMGTTSGRGRVPAQPKISALFPCVWLDLPSRGSYLRERPCSLSYVCQWRAVQAVLIHPRQVNLPHLGQPNSLWWCKMIQKPHSRSVLNTPNSLNGVSYTLQLRGTLFHEVFISIVSDFGPSLLLSHQSESSFPLRLDWSGHVFPKLLFSILPIPKTTA